MQGYVLEVVEELYYANDIHVTPTSRTGWASRQAHQYKAMSTLKLLVYVAQVSMEQGIIQPKQYEQISKQAYNTENLLGTWLISDQKRLAGAKQKQESSQQGLVSQL